MCNSCCGRCSYYKVPLTISGAHFPISACGHSLWAPHYAWMRFIIEFSLLLPAYINAALSYWSNARIVQENAPRCDYTMARALLGERLISKTAAAKETQSTIVENCRQQLYRKLRVLLAIMASIFSCKLSNFLLWREVAKKMNNLSTRRCLGEHFDV